MNDYGYDEYYDDEDYESEYEPELRGTSFDRYLEKHEDGTLHIVEVYGFRYSGQDWGEADFKSHTFPIEDAEDEYRELALKYGADMQPGDSISWLYPEEWEEDEIEDVSDIPF